MKNLLIITGASRGIGNATAQHFIDNNWDVINLSRTPCPETSVTNLTVDFSQENWSLCLPTLIDACKNAIKVSLVHNAACCFNDTIQSITDASLTLALRLNLSLIHI